MSLRTRLSIQKKLANRTPRVTGSTRCTLVPGYSTALPAASLMRGLPKVSCTTSSPPS